MLTNQAKAANFKIINKTVLRCNSIKVAPSIQLDLPRCVPRKHSLLKDISPRKRQMSLSTEFHAIAKLSLFQPTSKIHNNSSSQVKSACNHRCIMEAFQEPKAGFTLPTPTTDSLWACSSLDSPNTRCPTLT